MALHGAALAAWKRKHPALVARWRKPKKKRRKTTHTTTKRKKRSYTMAKKRRRGGRRRGGRRSSGGGGLFSLSKKDTQAALAAAGGYTYLATMAAEKPSEYDWFTKLPVVQSVGRAATVALIAGLAYKQGIAKKWTKPIAIGVGAVAVANLARRKFRLYEGTDGATALADADDGGEYLAGDVDLSHEFAAG